MIYSNKKDNFNKISNIVEIDMIKNIKMVITKMTLKNICSTFF